MALLNKLVMAAQRVNNKKQDNKHHTLKANHQSFDYGDQIQLRDIDLSKTSAEMSNEDDQHYMQHQKAIALPRVCIYMFVIRLLFFRLLF